MRPDRPRPDSPRPDGPRPDRPRPDSPRPDGPRPDRPRPDGPRPDGPRPDRPRPDGPRPDGPRPGGPRPDGPRPGGRPPYRPGPPPSSIDYARRHFHGYHSYWTNDWYRRHPGLWNPYWIPSYRWWYRPSWYDTWGWYGPGFFTGVVVGRALDPYPYYYGDNIVYRGNMVYVNGVPYVSANEYYRQALALAQTTAVIESEPPVAAQGPTLVPPEVVRQEVSKPVDQEKEWLPMGTFAFLSGEDEKETNQIMQLATNKEGQVRGNYVDETTGESRQVVGAVDPKTQRVALRFVGDDKTVMECGLWNLTQDSVPILVHYDADDSEQHTLVRLAQTDEKETPPASKQEGPFLFDPEEVLAP